ncbi:CBS domain-containing protein [Marinimicrobium agarilyticum]|uniref:CBS domain-containing protein n=1 Tax=Marinimicrobium agarilyticum TaxID=306546 RepID=UPI000402B0B8|nr:CBS domain-containing protein [Marinimicrobium agarilyticum]
MKALKVYQLDSVDHLVKPREFSDIDEHSPALNLMTDFRQHQPHTVSASARALGVAKLMAMEEVDSKLVVDRDQEFIGLLTAERLSEQYILVTQTMQGLDRDELTAADMMLPRSSIPALDYDALKSATVGDLIRTLREAGENHCLVLDRDHHHIRGLISIEEVAERLHRAVAVTPKRSIVKALSF